MDFVRLSAACIIALDVLAAAFGSFHANLPLGGSHLAQSMIVLGAGFFAQEVRSVWKSRNGVEK
jgi:hypothetical protein